MRLEAGLSFCIALIAVIFAVTYIKEEWFITMTLIIMNALHWGSSFVPWSFLDFKQNVPIVVNHFSERYGLLLIIVIGEGIITLLYVDTELDKHQYLCIFLCYFTLVCVHFLYFEFQPPLTSHALRLSSNRARIWLHSLYGLYLSVLTLAVGLKLILTNLVEYDNYKDHRTHTSSDHRRFLAGGGDSYDTGTPSKYVGDTEAIVTAWALTVTLMMLNLQWLCHYYTPEIFWKVVRYITFFTCLEVALL
eukprot:UN02030